MIVCCNEVNPSENDYFHKERYEEANRFKTKLYLNLFKQASDILTKYQPCSHCHDMGMCCCSCRYLLDKGCGIMSLACRTWLCIHVEGSVYSKVVRAFNRLTTTAVYYDLYNEFFYIRDAPHYIRSSARSSRIRKKGTTKTLLPSFRRQARAKVRHRT